MITTRTSPIFIQKRLGLHKQEFKIFKLRTMKNDKVTSIGKLYRKTGFDEIPQLLNIVNGDMKFIGPRPLTMEDVKRLEWDKPEFEERWHLKPGLTGIAQLSPICDKDVTWKNDTYYIQNKSIQLDLKILAYSFLIPVFGKSTKRILINDIEQ